MNVFGRLNNALAIFCALGVGAEVSGQTIDENGYLSAGIFTLTFTSIVKTKMNATCGVDVSGVPDDTGLTVTSTAGAEISSLDTLFTNFFSQKTQTAWGTVSSATTLAWSSKANMLTTPISHDGN